MFDEQRERLLIAGQIEPAKSGGEQLASGSGSRISRSPPLVEEGVEKVVPSLSTKPIAATTTALTLA